jgi:tRNA1Val (adenine37-N6)-methyltransferase
VDKIVVFVQNFNSFQQLSENNVNTFQKIGERLEDLGLNGLQILQNPDHFCFGIDAVLLAWYASGSVHYKTRTIDLGTGTGVIPLLLYGRTGTRHIDALEIQPEMADMAKRSVALNDLNATIHVTCGDLRHPGSAFHSSSYDVVVCNPPYMRTDRGKLNPRDNLAIARHEITCTLADVAGFAKTMLKDRGKLFLIQRADRLVDLATVLREHQLEIKRLRPVYPSPGKPANLLLIEAMKKGRPHAIIETPLMVYQSDGQYSREINAIYGTPGPQKK